MSLRLEAIRRVVRRRGLDRHVTLDLAPGQLYVLLGPTLAGKTSLMRLIAGLDRPSRAASWSTASTSPGCRCASAASPWSISSSSTTRRSPPTTTSPRRCACRASRPPRSTAGARDGRDAAHRPSARPPAGASCRAASSSASRSPGRWSRARLLLLDEPLVNLDYKLREELRAELRDLFARQQTHGGLRHHRAARGADHGRRGRSSWTRAACCRAVPPSRSIIARARCGWPRVFSDPPMNMLRGRPSPAGMRAAAAGCRCRCRVTWPACRPGRTRSACAPTIWRSSRTAGRHRDRCHRRVVGDLRLRDFHPRPHGDLPGWCRRRACICMGWVSR